MKKSIIFVSLLLAFWLVSYSTFAQCVEPPVYITSPGCPNCYTANGGQQGSSFQSCMTGEVSKIGIEFNTNNNGDANALMILRDVLMPGAPGTVGATNEYVQNIIIAPGGGIQEFNLNVPFAVLDGLSYAWFVQESIGGDIYINGASGNPYPNGGDMNGFSSGPSQIVDLVFQVTINPSLPIPTLSQWGIITLSMIMLIFGVVALKDSIALRLQGKR